MDHRICASVCVRSLSQLAPNVRQAFNDGAGLVEVRVDYLRRIDLEGLQRALKPSLDRIILTCRRPEEGGRFIHGERNRVRLLASLRKLEPKYVDIELQTLLNHPQLASADGGGTEIIVSWHSMENTPAMAKLLEVYSKAKRVGRLVKIVTKARKMADNMRILSLYSRVERGSLIAFCAGPKGVISRILCLLLGSPFTYTSVEKKPTAPGQLTTAEMRDLLHTIASIS